MKKIGIIALILCLCIAMAGFAGGKSAEGAKTVKLGLSTPMTGTGSAAGAWISSGMQMAAEEINAAGGILGAKVELIVLDDAGNASQATTVINRLYFQENVLAVFGPNMSSAVVGVHHLAQQAKRPMLVGGTAPSFDYDKLKNDYLFRIRTDDNIRVSVLIKYILETMKVQKPGIIVGTTEYCTGALAVAQEIFKANNIPVLITEQIKEGDKDATGQITKMKAAGIDVVVGLTHEPEAAIFVTQAKNLGLDVPMTGFSAWGGPMFTDVAGEAAVGVISPQSFHPDLTSEKGKAWAKAFEAKYKLPASEHAQSYYDGLFLFKAICEKAGSFDVQKILQAMPQVEYQGINKLKMDQFHNFCNTVYMGKWNGKNYEMISKSE